MKKVVKKGEMFSTFNYDGKDSSDMGIINVTNGSTYTYNIEPIYTDERLVAPAYDGKYYYGTQITGQQFQFNCFALDLLSTEYNKLRSWLNPRTIGRLILSDQPYKYYLVKVASIGNLGEIPLTTIQTPDYSVMGDKAIGEVVYTGSFTVTFETVGSAYGYGMCYYRDDLIYDAAEKYGRDYYYNSGLLYKDMNPNTHWKIKANANNQDIPMYNPGSADAQPIYFIEHEGQFDKGSLIEITNETKGTATVINLEDCVGTVAIDMVSQTLTDSKDNIYYGRFSGTAMKINPYDSVIELPETFVENIEDTDLIEYDSFYIENNIVTINPKVLLVTEEMKGQYFCVNNNGGSQILEVDTEKNTLSLNPAVYTADLLPAEVDDGVIITLAGFEFNYIEVNNEMPSTGEEGDVCVVNNVWYTYTINTPAGDGEWIETNYFDNKEDFKDIYGNYVPKYKMFGATIVKLDDIKISTGTGLGASTEVGAFTLSAELQPRYL